uniref:AB hydrolase-1 domain-containing protein n=2 Tax=Kalanchoe fedtschenkoi TaxID=63787 RepID=A0A7N0UEU3_KALFE
MAATAALTHRLAWSWSDFNSPSCSARPIDSRFAHMHSLKGANAAFKASLRPPNASSSPLAGDPFSGQVIEEVKRRRRRTVAGVDQDELLDPKLLADPDSYFCEFEGVHIHHKVYHAEPQECSSFDDLGTSRLGERSGKIGIPMVLLHGFGASVFSWSRVMKPLAELIGSKVLSFDRPAFGLTSRVDYSGHSSSANNDAKPLNPYSMAFSVLATLHFIKFLEAKQAILVGHSAGAYVAVNAYFKDPESVAALILVAPAILAPRVVHKTVNENDSRNEQSSNGNSDSSVNSIMKILMVFLKFVEYIKQSVRLILEAIASVLTSLYKKALSAILRSAIGVIMIRILIDRFGIAVVKTGWYDPKQVSDHIIEGYTKPLKTKNWDRALLEFTASLLTDPGSEMELPLGKRLCQISCPVLIITGDTDRIVPAWNAKRLQQAIPGSYLELIKNCGHLPQEERVEEFIAVIDRFLKRTFGGSAEQLSEQAVA